MGEVDVQKNKLGGVREENVTEQNLEEGLCTMKLLILTCLMAVALARPKLHFRHAEVQNQEDSSEHTPVDIRQEIINDLNRQRELLTEKQNDEIKNQETTMESIEEHVAVDPMQRACSSSSSSEEDASINSEQKHISTEEMSRQHYLVILHQFIKS
ncbi:alpha-S1-casein [Dipodomys spectabilis]|uniref:alpha-S1-casein n=1 Tax=Dipodomys spectabilis TaxID=105255 RepID=UPI001C537489|nr:alpha-S1-casein [Dipodomys spectabilis]